MKKFAGDIINLHMCSKNHNHDVQFLGYGVRQTKNFVIFGHFLPFYHPPSLPNDPENQNFGK